MRVYDIILKKRNGGSLMQEEMEFLIDGFVKDNIPDYQMAAFCMAVFFQGLTPKETSYLTKAMVASGDRVDLSGVPGVKVDKHSTGGVGDKTTLVVAPLVASLGVPVAKMSGRGLGHTGGTIDKLESIPGFRTDLSIDAFVDTVRRVGAAVVGQTGNLVPGDKKLYALRDVTATVDSIPLIASSIMSKKIAAGCDALVLDVKVGSGAFMKNLDDARTLGRLMLDIGSEVGIRAAAVLSSADQPLGNAVGNALEVKEAVETLQGAGPEDLEKLCLEVAAQMLMVSGAFEERDHVMEALRNCLNEGLALDKFRDMVEAQGGNPAVIEDSGLLPKARLSAEVTSTDSGFVTSIDAEQIGLASVYLGAGRSRKEDPVDPSAGLIIKRKIGDYVREGEPLAEIYFNDEEKAAAARGTILSAYTLGGNKPDPAPLIYEIICG